MVWVKSENKLKISWTAAIWGCGSASHRLKTCTGKICARRNPAVQCLGIYAGSPKVGCMSQYRPFFFEREIFHDSELQVKLGNLVAVKLRNFQCWDQTVLEMQASWGVSGFPNNNAEPSVWQRVVCLLCWLKIWPGLFLRCNLWRTPTPLATCEAGSDHCEHAQHCFEKQMEVYLPRTTFRNNSSRRAAYSVSICSKEHFGTEASTFLFMDSTDLCSAFRTFPLLPSLSVRVSHLLRSKNSVRRPGSEASQYEFIVAKQHKKTRTQGRRRLVLSLLRRVRVYLHYLATLNPHQYISLNHCPKQSIICEILLLQDSLATWYYLWSTELESQLHIYSGQGKYIFLILS